MINHPYSLFVAPGSESTDAYNTWLAIQFFWRPGGPWKSGILPDPHSENPAEKCAAKLKQKAYSADEAGYKKSY